MLHARLPHVRYGSVALSGGVCLCTERYDTIEEINVDSKARIFTFTFASR